ncbi:MAG: FKBP-type peptidyl-prolyl cis-trans isomerase [Bacteroidales bacterium]
MKKLILTILCGVFIVLTTNAQKMETKKDTISYLIGYSMGGSLKGIPFEFAMDKVSKGVQDAFSGKESGFSQEEMAKILNEWQTEMSGAQEAQSAQAALENKAKGKLFLEKNAKEKGVKQTESGLQYKVIKEGKGKKPLSTDKVKVHYVGTLIDGTEFDSSVKRGEPITFPLNGVIPGWTEGVQLMNVGSKYLFYIPSELGYGDRTVSIIPAGSTLIFEVELLEINPAE